MARKAGVPAYRVDGPAGVQAAWLADAELVGVTAGASAPDQRVQAVIDAVAPRDGVEVVRISDEDEYFPLPPQLRRFVLALQAAVEGAFACRQPSRRGPLERDRDWGATEALALLDV